MLNYPKRHCKLQNLSTGEIVNAGSIKEFCRLVGFGANEYLHITPILDGDRFVFKNWVLPENYKKLNVKTEFEDIYGNKYKFSYKEIHAAFELKFFPSCFIRFLDGESKIYKGLFRANDKIDFLPKKDFKVKKYIMYKGKQKYVGTTILEVAEKTKISLISAFKLIHGIIYETNGVKFGGVEKEKKSILC